MSGFGGRGFLNSATSSKGPNGLFSYLNFWVIESTYLVIIN